MCNWRTNRERIEPNEQPPHETDVHDRSYQDYTYDNIGQLTLDDSSVNSEDRGYTYDAAWNLNTRVRNGTSDSFAVDSRNQLTSEPAGSCTYDARGNLINDAGKVLVYDDENQLIEWRESSSPTSGAVASTFVYDGLGRLRIRGGYLGNGSSWVFQSAVYYIYDGRNVIQERDGDNLAQVAYTRGTDLSGSLEGAGGIGGLLARSHDFTECSSTLNINITNVSGYCIYDLTIWDDYGTYVTGATIDNGNIGSYSFTGVAGRTYYVFGWSCDPYYIQAYSDQFTGTLENHDVEFIDAGGGGDYNISESGNPLCLPGFSGGQWLTHNYYHADGNGNITALESSAETLTASYRYDPFGNTVSQSGGLANANKYRFSSKMIHATSGFYYYGYRFYSPNLQRWVNRDPIGEAGGLNLFEFGRNNTVNLIDLWGLDVCIYDEAGGPQSDQHRWVEVHREGLVAAFGFYPKGSPFGSAGEIQIPDPKASHSEKISRKTYHTTPEQEAALLKWAVNLNSPYQKIYGWYSWPTSQCRSFTDKVEKKLGDEFKVPPTKDQPKLLNPSIGHRTEEAMLNDIKIFIEKYLPQTPETKPKLPETK